MSDKGIRRRTVIEIARYLPDKDVAVTGSIGVAGTISHEAIPIACSISFSGIIPNESITLIGVVVTGIIPNKSITGVCRSTSPCTCPIKCVGITYSQGTFHKGRAHKNQ